MSSAMEIVAMSKNVALPQGIFSNSIMDLWNIKSLSIPPINTYKAVNTNIDINHMARVFYESKKFFDNDHYMRAEYAVLSKIVYRTKQKFRSAKDFKALEKIYKALFNYFKTNISNDLKSFMNLIPARYEVETYLPNKNILDFILVRLQGIAKLLERIVETCKITAYLFDKRIQTGQFWKIGLIIFSLVSRIYILAKYNVKFICEFYNKILPFSRQLKNNGRNWLPEGYILPTDLQKWMNLNWLDIDDELQIIDTPELPTITQFFDLVDDDDDIQFCQEYIMVDDDDIELINQLKSLDYSNFKQDIQDMRGFNMDEDIGEVIEINDSTLLFDESAPLQKDEESNIMDNLHICNSLPCTEVCDNHSNSGEVIEINRSGTELSKKIITQSDESKSNEIIVLDDSLLSNSKENCSDIGEVIEISDSFQINNKNKNLGDNQVINVSDNSLSELGEVEYLGNSLQLSVPNRLLRTKKRINKKKKNSGNSEINVLAEFFPLKKAKGISKKYSNITASSNLPLTKSYNIGDSVLLSKALVASDKETISISDSSVLTEDVHNTMKQKKFKTKKNRNVIKACSTPLNEDEGIKNKTCNTRKLTDNIVNLCGSKKKKKMKQNNNNIVNLCGSKKKKKMKQNNNKTLLSNATNLKRDHTEHPYRPNKKRKWEEIEVSHGKRNGITNVNIEQYPTKIINLTKKKLMERERFNTKEVIGNSNSQAKESRQALIQNLSPLSNRNSDSNKSKKSKKKKLKKLNKVIHIAQQMNNLKDIANKIHYNAQDLKRNSKSRKKKKNRYFN